MYSTVAELKKQGYDIRTLNVRNYMSLAQKYRVRAVPTFVYVVNGREVRRITGPASKNKIARLWRS